MESTDVESREGAIDPNFNVLAGRKNEGDKEEEKMAGGRQRAG